MWAVIGLAGSFEAIVVDLVEPEEGQSVGLKAGEQPARAEVLNFTDEEIAAVSFSLEGKPLGEDASAPYEARWDPAGLSPGPHELTATARTKAGKTATARRRVVVVAGDLKVSFLQPESGAVVVGSVELRARVDNQTGEKLEGVTYLVDGEELGRGEGESFGRKWTPSPGRHELTAVARTASGKEARDRRTVQVEEALGVSLTAPAGGPLVAVVENRTDSPIQGVVFEADGKVLGEGTLAEGSTFHFAWKPGGHKGGPVELLARATLEDGTTAEDRLTVTLSEPIRATFYATVTDANGRHQTGLGAAEFEVVEDGVPQTDLTVQVTTDKTPVSMAVVVDHSGSMVGSMEGAVEAARNFVDLLRPADRACLVAFSDRPRKAVDFTSDRAALKKELSRLKPRGGTALYDSIDLACDLLSLREGRRAVILLTDGKDENDPGTAPGSVHTLTQALEGARKQECTLYCMGLGKGVDRAVLTKLADGTGGRAYFPPTVKDLKDTYAAVATELRSQYEVAWTSSNPT
ncbi:MAG: VWA domain-containing protein, partial [Candidatus Eremiobacterota bacterium]